MRKKHMNQARARAKSYTNTFAQTQQIRNEKEEDNEYPNPKFKFKNVTDQQIAEAIQRLNPQKAPGLNDLGNMIYKQCK